MKYAVLLVLFILAQGAQAQPPKQKSQPTRKAVASKPKPKPVATPIPTPSPTPMSEKEQFEKASAHEITADRVAALEKFLASFPESEKRPAAADLLTSSRGLLAEEKLLSGDPVEAVKTFRQLVAEAPQPIPDELFAESIAKIPATLFRRGQREAAFDLASAIEAKVESSTTQLLEIANFYVSVENGGEAMRVAAKAAAKDPTSAAVYRTLALAHRINFDIEESANAYAKALELEPGSSAAKRGLAEMKRALGKSDEAAALYRDLLSKNDADTPSRTGLVLALFDAGKRTEAETELAAAIEKTPGNFVLLAGAAYWYASRGIGAKAVELAEKALTREPRYIWSHIALARGLIAEGKPVAAEQVLVKARAHGNFPTLEYELASARAAAGFYRDAAQDLARHFALSPGGVKTHLGGRVQREEKTLFDLVAYERKASIFTPNAADSVDSAETLRALLDLDQKIHTAPPNEGDVATAADAFVKGGDKMKLHRQLYAATLLLQNRVAVAKALELVKAATGNTDTALDVASPGAAVMASELYESRATAFRANDFLLVPEVPRPTLSAILRGRIEELAGWALYQQGSYPDSIIRLRRAITVMPDKSAWWRSSMWRLGAALAADGKDTEALNAYIDSYKTDKPDFAKYAVVESLYKKVHGSTDGLEAKIGAERVAIMSTPAAPATAPSETPAVGNAAGNSQALPAVSTDISNSAAAKPEIVPPAKATETGNTTDKPITVEKDKSEPKVETPSVKIETKAEPPVTETKTEVPPVPAETKTLTPPVKTETKLEAPPVTVENTTEIAQPKVETKTDPPPVKVETKTETPPVAVETKPPPDVSVPEKKTETEAVPEPKPEPVKRDQPVEKPPDTRSGGTIEPTKTTERSSVNKEARKDVEPVAKPLFEPVIITVPTRKPIKPNATTADASKPSTDEKKIASEEKASLSGPTTDGRPRVIAGQEVKAVGPETCKIGFSQETVSVINDGGKVGMLVHVEAPGDIKKLVAVSNSPKDIEIVMHPEISGMPDRRFFVIKSTSDDLGIYQISFSTPCGKKDLIVTVR